MGPKVGEMNGRCEIGCMQCDMCQGMRKRLVNEPCERIEKGLELWHRLWTWKWW